MFDSMENPEYDASLLKDVEHCSIISFECGVKCNIYMSNFSKSRKLILDGQPFQSERDGHIPITPGRHTIVFEACSDLSIHPFTISDLSSVSLHITRLSLANDVTAISAGMGCCHLIDCTPEWPGVKSISSFRFKDFHLPKHVESINHISAENITVDEGHDIFYLKDGCLIGKLGNVVLYHMNNKCTKVPDEVTEIEPLVLTEYDHEEIELPYNITFKGNDYFKRTKIKTIVVNTSSKAKSLLQKIKNKFGRLEGITLRLNGEDIDIETERQHRLLANKKVRRIKELSRDAQIQLKLVESGLNASYENIYGCDQININCLNPTDPNVVLYQYFLNVPKSLSIKDIESFITFVKSFDEFINKYNTWSANKMMKICRTHNGSQRHEWPNTLSVMCPCNYGICFKIDNYSENLTEIKKCVDDFKLFLSKNETCLSALEKRIMFCVC